MDQLLVHQTANRLTFRFVRQILEGGQVVDRTGAVGKLRSVYCRDPDGNLIE
jgi:catechol 2,3-dioxygenase-like lactoylglutathione lyase family enzyme